VSEEKKQVSAEEVLAVLRTCYDPEIPVNIVDLGLIYDLKIENGRVAIKMTLTAPGCPVWPQIAEEVRRKVEALEGVQECHLEFVWDPPWNPEMMTFEARYQLGLI